MDYAGEVELQRRPNRRIVIYPLLALAVAAIVWTISAKRQERQDREVAQFVAALCDDLRAGNEPASGASQTYVGRAALERLAKARDASPSGATLDAIVRRGDDSDFADGTATHTAVIRIDGKETLGLRIRHDGEPDRIEIIGLFDPPTAAASSAAGMPAP